jgi:OHCU decarboxylase
MTTTTLLELRPSALNEEEFVQAYGDVYEHSPWIARETFQRGLGEAQDTPEGLAATMAHTLESAPKERQLDVLRAHPDLAGKAAVAGKLTSDSTSEQAGAGLDQCTPEEFERFQELNHRYHQRFGFPFILAVKGYQRPEILQAFAQRVENTPEQERHAAIEQVNRIALLRLRGRTEGLED